MPTRASYAEGGYEVQSSPFAPGAGEQLADEARRALTALRQGKEGATAISVDCTP